MIHTHIATHIRDLACHTRIWNIYFTHCILHMYFTPYSDMTVLWYPNCCLVSWFFMHSEYKNGHTYLLPFTATALLNFLKFANKTKYLHFRNFDWLIKIHHILDECVYLKRPKRLCQNGNLTQYLWFIVLKKLRKNSIQNEFKIVTKMVTQNYYRNI